MRDRFTKVARASLGWLAILIGWQVVVWLRLLDPVLLPSPKAVAEAMILLANTIGFREDVAATIRRTFLAFVIAVAVAAPAGLLIGANKKLEDFTAGITDFLRSLPVVALFPVFVLLFGIGDLSKIAAAALAAGLLILMNVVDSVQGARKERMETLKIAGAGPIHLLVYLYLPSTLPGLLTGMRAGISLGLAVVLVMEMLLGGHHGVGKRIYDFATLFQTDKMYGAIVVAGVLGAGLNLVLRATQKVLVHWSGE